MFQTFFARRALKEKLGFQWAFQGYLKGIWALGHSGTRRSLGHSGAQRVLWHSRRSVTQRALRHLGTQGTCILGNSGTWALGQSGTRALEGHLDTQALRDLGTWALEALYLADSVTCHLYFL